jgi:hypothetical protein
MLTARTGPTETLSLRANSDSQPPRAQGGRRPPRLPRFPQAGAQLHERSHDAELWLPRPRAAETPRVTSAARVSHIPAGHEGANG